MLLFDDINYERDTTCSEGRRRDDAEPSSIDGSRSNRWKELNADAVIVGTIRKSGNGVIVQVRMIELRRRTAFGKDTVLDRQPARYAHTSPTRCTRTASAAGVARTSSPFV